VQLVKLRRGSLNQKREGREWAVHKAWLQPQCHRKKKEKGRKKEGGREEGRKEKKKQEDGIWRPRAGPVKTHRENTCPVGLGVTSQDTETSC
jgi:hypothetical protein